jgi:hypothetical protein
LCDPPNWQELNDPEAMFGALSLCLTTTSDSFTLSQFCITSSSSWIGSTLSVHCGGVGLVYGEQKESEKKEFNLTNSHYHGRNVFSSGS